MAQLKKDQIGLADFEKYLNEESDFSFEMEVLKKFRDLQFSASHGGTYKDPITGKIREFDIRANINFGSFQLSLAVECKNIRSNFPLFAHQTARLDDEANVDIIYFLKKKDHSRVMLWPEKRVIKNDLFKKGELVAKKIDQVGRDSRDEIVSGDSQVFEKITQAVNSSFDLIRRNTCKNDVSFTSIISPWLVIPDNRLWGISYNDDGTRINPAKTLSYCSWLLNQSWFVESPTRIQYVISNLEIVTFSKIEERVNQFLEFARRNKFDQEA